ncbi:MAG: phosphoenolpyruvate-utilizing N-terminal domain-containing protein, partial [Gammaproteobacteria bacterium]
MPSMIHRLQRIVQEVNRAPDINHALVLITESLIRDLTADACTIFLARKDDPGVMVLQACSGLNPEIIGKVERRLGEGLIGTIAERAEAMNLTDAPAHKKFKHVPGSGEKNFPIMLGVPIIAHRNVLGVISVQRAGNAFNEDEEAYLTTLAAQLATSIERAESLGQFTTQQKRHVVKGVAGAPGMAIGEALVLNRGVNLESVPDRKTADIEGELKSFREAVRKVRDELMEQAELMRASLPEEECALFLAYAQMLGGGSLIDDTERSIETGNWAPSSWRDTVEQHAHVFTQMEDDYLAERANDIRDLGLRVLRKLMLEQNPYLDFPERTILVGDEVTATDLADVPLECLAGILSAHGSSSSHVAILAHALGIPAVMGVPNLPVKQLDGIKVVVDGYNGTAFINPDRSVLREYNKYLKEEAVIEKGLLELKSEPAMTLDQHRVTLLVNTGLMSDYTPSLRSGAEGVGLYRTEIPFQVRDRFPSEEEQFVIYRSVLETFRGMP